MRGYLFRGDGRTDGRTGFGGLFIIMLGKHPAGWVSEKVSAQKH